MAISDDQLLAVKTLVLIDRAIPAIIVRGIIDRLDALEQALCPRCRSRHMPAVR